MNVGRSRCQGSCSVRAVNPRAFRKQGGRAEKVKKRDVLQQKDSRALSGNFSTHEFVFQQAKTMMGREAS